MTDTSALPAYKSILQAASKLLVPVFITGDFNLPDVCWKTHHAPGSYKQDEFRGAFAKFGFRQYVRDTTHHNAILDLVFCNDESFVLDVDVQLPLSTSDHNVENVI